VIQLLVFVHVDNGANELLKPVGTDVGGVKKLLLKVDDGVKVADGVKKVFEKLDVLDTPAVNVDEGVKKVFEKLDTELEDTKLKLDVLVAKVVGNVAVAVALPNEVLAVAVAVLTAVELPDTAAPLS
jgi:hypothetical protein